MKKILLAVIAVAVSVSGLYARHGSGGSAFGGALAGSMIGGIATSAIVSGNSNRASDDAARARQETEQLRRDQERERVQRLENQVRDEELKRKMGGGNMFNFLFGLVIALIIAVIGLGFLIVKKR
ncbi:hypothetical protein K2W90_00545 [Candidatus Babeliales bacterium]|nr:hypothetical protein [Candidatus Babeliales bacterium]